MRNQKACILLSVFSLLILHLSFICFAQEDLAQLKDSYFNQHKYSEFVDYLKGIRKDTPTPEASYYIALSRYKQLRYLGEAQKWEEYFKQGEEYRQEFTQEAFNALKLASKKDPLFIFYPL